MGAQLWNYGVKILVLSLTIDIDLDGTSDSRFLAYFLSFYQVSAVCKDSTRTNKMLSTFK